MQRSFTCKALVINVTQTGENNSFVTLLTAEKGIVRAVLYGGPKSRMRSVVSQWNCGTIWLYENPEKNQIKITDFEVTSFHHTFSENLYKNFAASLAAELAIKTQCAGSNGQCFALVSGFLDGMELCSEDQSKVGLIRFLWRYLELLGIQPQTSQCSCCSNLFLNSKFAPNSISYYNIMDNSFFCPECISSAENQSAFLPIKTEALLYLQAVSSLPPAQVRKMKIDREDYNQIKQIVFFLIENCVERKLNSIETGMGIL